MSKRNGNFRGHPIRESDEIRDAFSRAAYSTAGSHPTSAKCAAPPCDSRVAYAGDFCATCRRVQRDMTARLRARR